MIKIEDGVIEIEIKEEGFDNSSIIFSVEDIATIRLCLSNSEKKLTLLSPVNPDKKIVTGFDCVLVIMLKSHAEIRLNQSFEAKEEFIKLKEYFSDYIKRKFKDGILQTEDNIGCL